jgi:hypothetical protein
VRPIQVVYKLYWKQCDDTSQVTLGYLINERKQLDLGLSVLQLHNSLVLIPKTTNLIVLFINRQVKVGYSL